MRQKRQEVKHVKTKENNLFFSINYHKLTTNFHKYFFDNFPKLNS